MNNKKQGLSEREQEAFEKMRLSKLISAWAGKYKKAFWKYEVSCFYKTYMLRISNLPEPAAKDILLSANNRLLNDQQRTELCKTITKACAESKAFKDSSIDVQIDYDNGTVIAEVL